MTRTAVAGSFVSPVEDTELIAGICSAAYNKDYLLILLCRILSNKLANWCEPLPPLVLHRRNNKASTTQAAASHPKTDEMRRSFRAVTGISGGAVTTAFFLMGKPEKRVTQKHLAHTMR